MNATAYIVQEFPLDLRPTLASIVAGFVSYSYLHV